jgi:hypothetical protein
VGRTLVFDFINSYIGFYWLNGGLVDLFGLLACREEDSSNCFPSLSIELLIKFELSDSLFCVRFEDRSKAFKSYASEVDFL